jgi:hypothetical protein
MAGPKTAPEIFEKTAGEVIIKNFEFDGPDLDSDETISSIDSSSVTPTTTPPLAIDSTSLPGSPGTVVQATLSGGLDFNTYEVLVRVSTSTGQTLDAIGRVRVRS